MSTTTMISILLILSPELPAEVLIHVHPSLLQTCRQVCRDFRTIVDTTLALQYETELWASGMENSAQNKQDLPNRLELLTTYQKSWEDLNFPHYEKISILRGGVWELFGGVLAQKGLKKDIFFYTLPSSIRGISKASWIINRPDFFVRDFSFDNSQDLVVMVDSPIWSRQLQESRNILHLRSLSSTPGEPHPLACDSKVLEHVVGFHDSGITYNITISGDYVAVLINTRDAGENELVVWNWHTGEKMIVLVGDEIKTYSFLSDEYLLLGTFIEHENSDDEDDDEGDLVQPCLITVNFRQEGSSRRRVTELDTGVTFHYAPLQSSTRLIAMEVRSDPSPGWSPPYHVDVPFHLARNHRMYVVTLWLQTSSHHGRCLSLFVPRSTFMRRLGDNASLAQKPTVYEWDEWGSEGSRLLTSPYSQSMVWMCYVYGMRYVTLEDDSETEGGIVCRVYDFNPVRLRRALRGTVDESQVNKEEGGHQAQSAALSDLYADNLRQSGREVRGASAAVHLDKERCLLSP